MEEKTQLSGLNLFFLWFGAAVSVAEILTGGYLAELGAVKGIWAIIPGHLEGTILLVLAGLIGFRERLPAIMSTRISFGKQGSYIISLINILQLVGWTAIMIIEGGMAMNVIGRSLWNFNHPTLIFDYTSLAAGIAFYYLIKSVDIPIGCTLTTIAFTSTLHTILRRGWQWGKVPGGERAAG